MNNNLSEKLKNILHTVSLEKLEKIFFALFLLSIPFQTRLTFITPQTYLNGSFNEYATFFLYLSDILFITTLLFYFVNIARKTINLTKTKNFGIKAYIWGIFQTYPRLIPIWTLLITFITWSFVGILWSEYKNQAFYQSFKILEFAILFLYIFFRLRWFGFNKFALLIFAAGFFQSIIGIAQYYLQRSVGLKILMESVLSPEIPNVAKIVVDGEKIIRAYGAFPHPNIFSGFLILSIFCGFWLLAIKLFHVKQFNSLVSRITTENVKDNTKLMYKIVSRETILANAKWAGAILYIIIILGTLTQLTALILTFSRTAWLAFVLIFFIFIFLTFNFKLFHVQQFKILSKSIKQFIAFVSFIFAKTTPVKGPVIVTPIKNTQNKTNEAIQIVSRETICIATIIIISLLIIISVNWKQITARTNGLQDIYQQSINTRILYNKIAINTIKEYPSTGIGGKNFTLEMQTFSDKPLDWWQFQPAHNIYLLIASELGITGLILFISLLYFILKSKIVSRLPTVANIVMVTNNRKHTKEIVSRETILLQTGLISILISFLFIGLFDHYLWTLQQGQLAFWIVLGAIASFKR